MPSTAEPEPSTVDHGSSGRGRGRLHVPALRQLYSRVSLRGRRKSTATESTVSSRPVVVRTYSPPPSPSSRSPSSARQRQPESSSAMHASPHYPSGPPPHLPPTADFSFAGILHAVEPEVSGAIDAIAAICARSRLCLADEYAAHRPPHEVLDPANPIPLPPPSSSSQTQTARPSQRTRWWSVVRDTALAAVPEASSSSERLTGSRTASRASLNSTATGAQSAKGGAGTASAANKSASAAYGSLKSFVSGDGSGSAERRRRGLAALFGGSAVDASNSLAASSSSSSSSSTDFAHAQWIVSDDGSGAIRLSPASSSPRVSLAFTEEPIAVNGSSCPFTSTAAAVPAGHAAAATPHHPSFTPGQMSRSRSASSPGWLPSWSGGSPKSGPRLLPAVAGAGAGAGTTMTAAEQRLKWLLEASSALRGGAPLVKQCGGGGMIPP
ncbi:hypothetical protein IWZ03DRAFT_91535 [Phyllosticta citriasiana]|uniref:Uncharacterized protein n=1 Tax=Phyllosticta citriasiana TaxID=595635 RepID=A0ABR1KAU6_9PEZI